MKILKVLLTFALFFSVSSTFANTLNTTLGTMEIKGITDQINKENQIITTISAYSQPVGDLSIDFTIDSVIYKNIFIYNQTTKVLSSSFMLPYTTGKVSYPFSLSIKNSSNRQLIATSGTLVLVKGVLQTITTSTGTTISSTGTTLTSTATSSALSTQDKKDVETASLIILQDIYSKYKTSSTRVSAISKSITALEAYVVKYPARKKVLLAIIENLKLAKNNLLGTTTPVNGNVFVPKYASQSAEPSKINGIGNSKSYNSWRVPKK